MGKGNVVVIEQPGTQFYVDNEDFHTYTRDGYDPTLLRDIDLSEIEAWTYDQGLTQDEWDDLLDNFKTELVSHIPSFTECPDGTWLPDNSGRLGRQAILENTLFYVAIEDNEWSMAVELIPKEDVYDEYGLNGLQIGHFDTVKRWIQDSLLDYLPKIHIRNGPWMSGTIYRPEVISA